MIESSRSHPDAVNPGRSSRNLAIILGSASVLVGLGLFLLVRGGPNQDQLRQEATKAAGQSRWADAERSLSLLTNPTPADWLLRAVVATSLNQPDAAAGYLQKIPPDGPLAARVALVTSRAELGRFRARPMEDALRLALKIDPKLTEARRSLIYLYGVQGRRDEMLDQFAILARDGALNFTLAHHWCIAHQEQIKEPDDLKTTLERFVENDPADRWSRLGLARVYRRLGQFDRAKECLAPLPNSDPDARAGRAEIEFDRGDLDALATLLADGPADHPKLARLRGQVALSHNDGAAAVKFFRLSDAAEPNHSETLYGLAQALRVVGDKEAAEPYGRRATAQRALRDHLFRLGNNKEPQASFCSKLAVECEAAGYFDVAKAWYRLAIAADPLYIPAQEGLARLSASNPDADSASRPAADANLSHKD